MDCRRIAGDCLLVLPLIPRPLSATVSSQLSPQSEYKHQCGKHPLLVGLFLPNEALVVLVLLADHVDQGSLDDPLFAAVVPPSEDPQVFEHRFTFGFDELPFFQTEQILLVSFLLDFLFLPLSNLTQSFVLHLVPLLLLFLDCL